MKAHASSAEPHLCCASSNTAKFAQGDLGTVGRACVEGRKRVYGARERLGPGEGWD